jgi:hypothetical protein
MEKWIDWYEKPYAEDDIKLNDFIEDALRHLSWELFRNQDKILYMANETDNGLPKMRDGAIDYIRITTNNKLNWLVTYMINRILVAYLKGNIEPSEEIKRRFNEDLPEEDCEEFWADIDEYIWNDYAKCLGEKRTAELWEKWGKAPRKEN